MTKKNTDFNFVTSLDPFGINPGRFSAIAISSNGLIAAASYPQSLVGVWNWKSGNKSFVLFQKVRDLGFSPDGLVLVTQSYHRELKFWNTSDATLIAVVENAQPFRFHSFSPDGRYFACSREESTAILDVESGRTIASFKRTKLPSNTKLASKGEFLVQTFANEVIVDPISESSNIKGVTLTCGDRVKSIAISPSNKAVARSCSTSIAVVDVVSAKELKRLTRHKDYGGALAYSPDGCFLACGSSEGTLRLFTTSKWNLVAAAKVHQGQVDECTFSNDNSYILSKSHGDEKTKLWSVKENSEINSWPIEYAIPSAFSSDCNLRVARKPPFLTMEGHQYSPLNCEAIGLWSAMDDKLITVLNEPPRDLPLVIKGNRTVALSSNGRTLAYACKTCTKIVNLLTGQTVSRNVKAKSLLLSDDGNTLVIATMEVVQIIAVATGAIAFEAKQKSSAVLALSKDGRFLATEGPNTDVTIWDLVSGKKRCRLKEPDYSKDTYSFASKRFASEAAFSPDGSFFVALKERFWARFSHTDDDIYTGAIVAWNIRSRKPRMWVSRGPTDEFSNMGFSDDGKELIVDFKGTDTFELCGGTLRNEQQIRSLSTLELINSLCPGSLKRSTGFTLDLDFESNPYLRAKITSSNLKRLIESGEDYWKALIGPRALLLGISTETSLQLYEPNRTIPTNWREQMNELAEIIGGKVGKGLRAACAMATVGEALEKCSTDEILKKFFLLPGPSTHGAAFDHVNNP